MEAFGDLGTWILQNIPSLGFTGALLVFFYLLIDGKVVLGREAQAGKDALKSLPEVNEKLTTFRVLAAQQEVRDEFGSRELAALKRNLADCENELATCHEGTPPRRRRTP